MKNNNKKMLLKLVFISVFVISLILPIQVEAEKCTLQEAKQVSENWLIYIVTVCGPWNGESKPTIKEHFEIIANDTLVGYVFNVSPTGYIAMPILKECKPVPMFSETDTFKVDDTNEKFGSPALLKQTMQAQVRIFVKEYGSLDATQPDTGEVLYKRENKEKWEIFLKNKKQFKKELQNVLNSSSSNNIILDEVEALLTMSWSQYIYPYNSLCPLGFGNEICVLGCGIIYNQ